MVGFVVTVSLGCNAALDVFAAKVLAAVLDGVPPFVSAGEVTTDLKDERNVVESSNVFTELISVPVPEVSVIAVAFDEEAIDAVSSSDGFLYGDRLNKNV
jgi:hypothetical protein